MASHVSNYLFSGARGRLLVAVTLVFLTVLFLSFRGPVADSAAWQSAVDKFNGFAESKHPAVPPTVAPTEDIAAPVAPPAVDASSRPLQAPHPDDAEDVAHEPARTGLDKPASPELVQPAPPVLQKLQADDCEGFPDTRDVLLVMKTGATEAYNKLPIHFMSTLKCLHDFVVYSDMEMNMAGFKVHDVLKELDPEFMLINGDFDLYRTLQEYYKEHQDPRDLKMGMNGWNLDKYKFVPMLKRAWEYRPDANWYIFIEADSFVQWENMMQYLDTLDPTEPHYIGSPTYLDIKFAHGGTGYAISGGAMKKAVGEHPDLIAKYGKEVQEFCCGDRMTAKIMLDEDIQLTSAWPMFNGEKPLTLPFSREQWCQPVLTMHHLTAQEVSKAWNFQMKRKQKGEKTPMVWKDVFDYFVKDNLRALREDWENLSDDASFRPDPEADFRGRKWEELTDAERSSPESPEKCKALCLIDENCMQWQHHGRECQLHFSVKLGMARQPEGTERWVSGWNLKRVQAFRTEMKNCPEIDWTTHPPEP